ncbi:acyl-CoA synthetase [Azospirillum sp. TSO22-1]|uniref:acyl-CoA synthetase n=1 Tax=Azospirillum sp. TSO22-1 TaxID=716789 RepID=UPI000D6123C5|nr:acyl-CoA synthetase [Azospirillum sp. TSO22-1]PWC45724.1 acyl-CoA synthetase [Azospirillum sp. TSO22-1]
MARATHNPYETDLDQNAANTTPLTPLSFLRRTAAVFPNRTAVIHGPVRRTWAETYERCVRLASALAKRGIGVGDTVAVMAPNTPEAFEAHFGPAMIGAVLNALNIRLDAEALAFILGHGEARVLITDREFSSVMAKAVAMLDPARRPFVIDIDDPQAKGGELIGAMTYEQFLETGDPAFAWRMPPDEWEAIALNYTSGTTGNPKGVVYHHRGAYLNAMGNIATWAMPHHPVYLWTLPMFHCNGWCFPWTVTAMAGTNVCLRAITAKAVYDGIADHGVTHLCGAPIVMGLICNAPEDQRRELKPGLKMMTAGAAPPAAVIEKMERMGVEVAHVYGLTEVYGPVTICAWHEEWNELPLEERAAIKARQGVNYATLEGLMVADPVTLQPVPRDGETMGEIFMRGNTVMKGYLKNPRATQEAFAGGWFHTGDLGVWHPDGYIQIKDRSKDIIISGGENISTIEVEGVLYKHPAVLEAAVVARPDEKWGETPCAFVTLKEGSTVTEAEIIAWCRANLAHFKCPRTVVFAPLPKTSTGKIQKFVLREQAKAL